MTGHVNVKATGVDGRLYANIPGGSSLDVLLQVHIPTLSSGSARFNIAFNRDFWVCIVVQMQEMHEEELDHKVMVVLLSAIVYYIILGSS